MEEKLSMSWDAKMLKMLASEFRVTEVCVMNALKFRSRSAFSRVIRKRARELGSQTYLTTIRLIEDYVEP